MDCQKTFPDVPSKFHDFLSTIAWRIRQFAFPELFSILPHHAYFWCQFLEVLFLVAPILHEAWLALFEMFRTQG